MTDSVAPALDLEAWVGRSEAVEDVASRSAALGLAAVLDRPSNEADADHAALFPLGHWLQFSPTTTMSELGPDGHPRLGGFMPPLPLPRRMWAGSKIVFHAPVAVGQRLRKTTTIESITPKAGSTGELCFVSLRHDVTADDKLALVEHQNIVYREAPAVDTDAPSPARPPRQDGPAPDGWDWARALRPNEITLFRYSALTFNSHRIHYDHPYATGVEGYPGLVVHGPLSATYIVDAFLRRHQGATLTGFEFSARSPIFAGEQIHVAGRAAGAGAADLAVVGPDGKPAVLARIQYR
jgi:3-methylfumaryl-CoA hydratase